MNIFDEIEHRLSSKTRMRAIFKDYHIEDLEKIISRMSGILEEKRCAKNEADEARKQKASEIDVIKKLLEEKGLSLEDLGSAELEKPRKRKNTETFTFEYKTESGDTARWEGSNMGRIPSEFKAYLDSTGKKRLECAV